MNFHLVQLYKVGEKLMMKQKLFWTNLNLKEWKLFPFAAVIILILGVPFFWENGASILRDGYFTGNDFATFYGASTQVFDNDQSPYGKTPSPLLEKEVGHQIWPFLYPPTSLLIIYPLSVCGDLQDAGQMMLILNLALMILGIILTYNTLSIPKDIRSGLALVLIAYSFNFYAFKSTIGHGQVNFIILIFILLFWIALKRQSPGIIVALPLALAIMFKIYPILLAFVLLWRKDWRTIIYLGIYLIIGLLLSLVFLPSYLWSDWISLASRSGSYGSSIAGLDNIEISNLCLNGTIHRFFDGIKDFRPIMEFSWLVVPLSYITAIITICLANISSYFIYKKRRQDEYLDFELSIYLLTIFLIAPISWEHHLVMVFPAIIVVMMDIFYRYRMQPIVTVILIIPLVLLAWCFPWDGVLNVGSNRALSIYDAKVGSVVLLLFYLVYNMISRSKSSIDTV